MFQLRVQGDFAERSEENPFVFPTLSYPAVVRMCQAQGIPLDLVEDCNKLTVNEFAEESAKVLVDYTFIQFLESIGTENLRGTISIVNSDVDTFSDPAFNPHNTFRVRAKFSPISYTNLCGSVYVVRLEGPWYWLDKCPAPQKVYNKRRHFPAEVDAASSNIVYRRYSRKHYEETIKDISESSPDPEYRIYYIEEIIEELFDHYQQHCEAEPSTEDPEESDSVDQSEDKAPTFNPTFTKTVTKKLDFGKSLLYSTDSDSFSEQQLRYGFLVDFDTSGKSVWQCYKAICKALRGGMYVSSNYELVFDNYQGEIITGVGSVFNNFPLRLNPTAQIVSRSVVKDKEYPEVISAKYISTRFRTQSGESDSFLHESFVTDKSIYTDIEDIYHYPTTYETVNYVPYSSSPATGNEVYGHRGVHSWTVSSVWSPQEQGDKTTFAKVVITVPYTQKPFLYENSAATGVSTVQLPSIPFVSDGITGSAVANYSVLLLSPKEVLVSVYDFPVYYDRPMLVSVHCQKDYVEFIADTRVDEGQYTLVDCEEEKKELVREVWYFRKISSAGGAGVGVDIFYPHDKSKKRATINLDEFSPFGESRAQKQDSENTSENFNVQPSEGYCIQVGNTFFEIPVTTLAVVELQDIEEADGALITARRRVQKGIVKVTWNYLSEDRYDIPENPLVGIPCVMYFTHPADLYLQSEDVGVEENKKRKYFLCVLTSVGRLGYPGGTTSTFPPPWQGYPYVDGLFNSLTFSSGSIAQYDEGVDIPPPSLFAHVLDPPSISSVSCEEVAACIDVCDTFKDCFDDQEFEDFFCEKVRGCLGLDPENNICDLLDECNFDERIDNRLNELTNTVEALTSCQATESSLEFDKITICYVRAPACEEEAAQPCIIEGTECPDDDDPDPVAMLLDKINALEAKIQRLESQ
jgi:hypothetical protein